MDEDGPLLSAKFPDWPEEFNQNESCNHVSIELNENECETNVIHSHISCTSNVPAQVSVCNKCVDVQVELQKAKIAVEKLKKKCSDKASEIKRLKAAEKRSRQAKCTLEEMLQEMKKKKWITDEGQDVLNVNNPC